MLEKFKLRQLILSVIILFVVIIIILNPINSAEAAFYFAVTADQRYFTGSGIYDTPDYFRGVCEEIFNLGSGAFMISPGDIDAPGDSKWTIEQCIGVKYLWYPVVGNHDLPGAGSQLSLGANMDWLRAYNYDANGHGIPPDIVNTGPSGCPETTYSFEYENAHFVVLNEYCDTGGDDVTTGNIPDHLYNWLVADLAATTSEHIFLFGHEPAYPQHDIDNARLRHASDSLNQFTVNRDRFWTLLRNEGVVAYICGHSHNFSTYFYDGVWQLDAGHARGAGDTGAPSTFIMVYVDSGSVTYETYRDVHDSDYDYNDIIHTGTLAPPPVSSTIVPRGETWKYLDDGSDQGTSWQAPGFDDSLWIAGPAPLGYGNGDEATVVSYGPDVNNKYITTYFRHSFTVPDSSIYDSLILHVLRDDGAVVYLNGTEIYRTNIPWGTILYDTLASTPVGGAEEDSFFGTTVNAGYLVDGSNVLAVEIHQIIGTSSDISFDLELVGLNATPLAVPTTSYTAYFLILILVTLTQVCFKIKFVSKLSDSGYKYSKYP